MASSNIDRVVASIQGYLDSWSFTRPGADRSVGLDSAHKVAERISDRARKGEGPDGPWTPNTEGVAIEKDKFYGLKDNTPNVGTGQMLSLASLMGRTVVSTHDVQMIYGTNTAPTRSVSPSGRMRARDKTTTDVEKAYFAHTGQGPHGTQRPFYGLGTGDAEAVIAIVQADVDKFIREWNQS